MTDPTLASTLVELTSPHSFEGTLHRLLDAIQARGLTLFSQIDHAAMAHAAGLAMLPTTVLLYGNPRGGTPIMVALPAAALDLPLRLLVLQDEAGRTRVAYRPIVPTLQSIGVALDAAQRLLPAQAWIAETLAPIAERKDEADVRARHPSSPLR